MFELVAIDESSFEVEMEDDQQAIRCEITAFDRYEQSHRIALTGDALASLVRILLAVKERFPTITGGH